jgi:hypothetical protein
MKATSLLAGAVLLALATGSAVAQSASSPGLSESNFKCWDAAKNEVRDRLAGTPSMPSTGGASTTGSAASNSPIATSPPVKNPGVSVDKAPAPGTTISRPQEAAGLPTC